MAAASLTCHIAEQSADNRISRTLEIIGEIRRNGAGEIDHKIVVYDGFACPKSETV
jgi:hypothetical protein